jgi:hypothetical protein
VVAPAPPRFIQPWLLNLENFLESRLRKFLSIRYTQSFAICFASNQQRHRIFSTGSRPEGKLLAVQSRG